MNIVLTELRSVFWSPVVVLSVLAAGILAVDLVGPFEDPGSPLMWLGLGITAAAGVFVFDEPAAAAVECVPTSRRRRFVSRLAVVGGLVVLWLGFAGVAGSPTVGSSALSVAALATCGTLVILVAVSVVCAMRRLGHLEPGSGVAPAVVASVLAGLMLDLPGDLVLFEAEHVTASTATTWAVASVAALVTLAWATADPYAARPTRPAARHVSA